MNTEELRDKIQVAISKPENKYPTQYAKGESGPLHIWMVDTRKASESVIELLKQLNIIK